MRRVYVRPKNIGGSIEHYFHFLFGYLIPFLENTGQDDGKLYLFRDCGPVMNALLFDLPGYRTGIMKLGGDFEEEVCFPGYDRQDFPGMDMQKSRQRMLGLFKPNEFRRRGRVLVVDRGSPHPFYRERAEIPESGSSRRSIPNMREIFSQFRHVPSELVTLEGMTLRNQIRLFRNNGCFVLQHGASMANLLFCHEDSCVVEIKPEGQEDYFRELISRLGLRHKMIRQEHDHAPVDPKSVLNSALGFVKIQIMYL